VTTGTAGVRPSPGLILSARICWLVGDPMSSGEQLQRGIHMAQRRTAKCTFDVSKGHGASWWGQATGCSNCSLQTDAVPGWRTGVAKCGVLWNVALQLNANVALHLWTIQVLWNCSNTTQLPATKTNSLRLLGFLFGNKCRLQSLISIDLWWLSSSEALRCIPFDGLSYL